MSRFPRSSQVAILSKVAYNGGCLGLAFWAGWELGRRSGSGKVVQQRSSQSSLVGNISDKIASLSQDEVDLKSLQCIDDFVLGLKKFADKEWTPDAEKLDKEMSAVAHEICDPAMDPSELAEMTKDLALVHLHSVDLLYDNLSNVFDEQPERFSNGIGGTQLKALLEDIVKEFGDGKFGRENEEIKQLIFKYLNLTLEELSSNGQKGCLLTDTYNEEQKLLLDKIKALSQELSDAPPGQLNRHARLWERADMMEGLLLSISDKFDDVESWDSLDTTFAERHQEFLREHLGIQETKRKQAAMHRHHAATEVSKTKRLEKYRRVAEENRNSIKSEVSARRERRQVDLQHDLTLLHQVLARILKALSEEYDDQKLLQDEEVKAQSSSYHFAECLSQVRQRISTHEALSKRWDDGHELLERMAQWMRKAYAGMEHHAQNTLKDLRAHLPHDVLKHQVFTDFLLADMGKQIDILSRAQQETANTLVQVEIELLRLENARQGKGQQESQEKKSKEAEDLKVDIQHQAENIKQWESKRLDLLQHKEEFAETSTALFLNNYDLDALIDDSDKQDVEDIFSKLFFTGDRVFAQPVPGVRYDAQALSNRALLSGTPAGLPLSLQDSASVVSESPSSGFICVGSEVSAPARMTSQNCFLPGAALVDVNGRPTHVSNLNSDSKVSLLSDVKVLSVSRVQAVNRDITHIVCSEGSVQMTSDHLVLARHSPHHEFGPVHAKDLKGGMEVRTHLGGFARVESTSTHEDATYVWKIILRPGDAAAYLCGECFADFTDVFAIAVYAPPDPPMVQRIDLLARTLDVVVRCEESGQQTRSDPGVAGSHQDRRRFEDLPLLPVILSRDPSIGSHGHPTRCKGACKNFQKGFCKFAEDCRNCHYQDCRPYRPGQRQRHRKAVRAEVAANSGPCLNQRDRGRD